MSSYQILERFQMSRTGATEGGEDGILVTPHFAGVADGATAKTDTTYGTLTPGAMAVALLATALPTLDPAATIEQAAQHFMDTFQRFYQERKIVLDVQHAPHLRPCASLVLYSAMRREVWAIGDCMCRIGTAVFTHGKAIDQVLAATRAVVLEMALRDGALPAELQMHDPGREFILPLLRKQSFLQNGAADNPFVYGVVDGFPVPPGHLIVHAVPDDVTELVLATDGYPAPLPTLAEAEALLQQYLAADPLCFRYWRQTKGLKLGAASFDDRAYLRLGIPPRG